MPKSKTQMYYRSAKSFSTTNGCYRTGHISIRLKQNNLIKAAGNRTRNVIPKTDMERTLMPKNHVLTFLTPFSSKTTSLSSTTYTPLSHTSSLHQITLKTNTNPRTTITKNKPDGLPKNEPKITLPTMRNIIDSSKQQKVELKLQTLGPFFRITGKRQESEEEIGRAEGMIRVWFGRKILHLDSIKLTRETLGMEKSIFGIGVFLGAVAVRYGYDCGCTSAELLAINDSDLYHNKVSSTMFS